MNNFIQLISEVLQIKAEMINDDLSMENLESWDSLTHMDLVSMIENTYNIELSMDEIMKIVNIKVIKEVITSKNIEL